MRRSVDRLTAARLLMRVERGAFASRLLAAVSDTAVRVRVLEVLRWQRALDWVLQQRCRRRLADLDGEVRAALRLGLAEMTRLEVPPAVATDGAVHLVRRLGKSSAAGLVNAVLRASANRWPELQPSASIDVRLSHPAWLYRRWRDHFGDAAAEGSMAAAQVGAATWVWFFRDEPRRELERSGVRLEPHPWCPGSWRAGGNASRLVAAVRDGAAYAQDPCSQLVAHVGTSVAGEGSRAVDLCAAPGGKSALLARLARPQPLVSADRSLTRTRLMMPALGRAGTGSAVAADALAPPLEPRSWDLVLLDAPCTGTGTLRRHPEIKWRLEPRSIGEMAAAQRGLLAAARPLVAAGGVLLYATCSIEPEENEELIAEAAEGFEVENVAAALPDGTPWIPTAAGGVRILPHEHGDGFTIHALRRSR